MDRKRWIFITIMVVLSILLASACSSPSDTATVTTKLQSPSVQAQPKHGGTLNLMIALPPQHMDPIMQTGLHSSAMAKLCGSTLQRYAGKNNDELKVEPGIAKSLEIAPDGLSYTLKLQEGVRWQNIPPVNGRELTSADVKYSIERIMDPKTRSPIRSYLEQVDRIEAPDKYAVKVYMKSQDPSLLSSWCGGASTVVAREVVEKDGNAGKTIIGTGPFIYVPEESMANSRYVFKKNPDYWEKGKPYVDRVEVAVIQDEAAQLAAFRAGKLDQLVATKTVFDSIRQTVPDVNAIPGVENLGSSLNFGMKQNPKLWGDIRVRKAIMYAIDQDGLIQAVANGAGQRTMWIAPSFKDWGAIQPEQVWRRDMGKSRALLAEAGYPNGFQTTILQNAGRMDAWGGAVEPVASMLKDVGIQADIKPLQAAEFTSVTRTGEFEMCTAAAVFWTAEDPDQALYQQYHSNGGRNRYGYINPKVDLLIQQQREQVGSPELRKKTIRQIISILDEDIPLVPLFVQWKWHVTQPWVKGWDNAGDGGQQFAFHQVLNTWLNK